MTTEAQNPFAEVLSYVRHQASKGLPSLAALMERTGQDWVRCLEGMSDAQAEFGQAGEWTSKAVLGHILSVSRTVNAQIKAIAAGKDPSEPFQDLAPTAKQAAAYKAQSVPSLRAEAQAMMAEAKAVAESLEPDAAYLATTFKHPMFGQLNVPEWIAFQRVHSMDHMGQIDKNKADAAYPKA